MSERKKYIYRDRDKFTRHSSPCILYMPKVAIEAAATEIY